MRDLDDWRPNTQFRLLDYGAIAPSFRAQLLAVGLTPGVVVRVIRAAPLGNPIQVDLRGAMLALRCEDLQVLHWKKL